MCRTKKTRRRTANSIPLPHRTAHLCPSHLLRNTHADKSFILRCSGKGCEPSRVLPRDWSCWIPKNGRCREWVRFPRISHCRTCTRISFSDAAQLLADAIGIALICFCRSMITAKNFAVRNGYEVQADREFMALGLANIASGRSSGFPIAGRGFAYRNKRPHRGPITGERLDRGGRHGGGSCTVYRSASVYSECFPWRSAGTGPCVALRFSGSSKDLEHKPG
jgi:Sulfate permease family